MRRPISEEDHREIWRRYKRGETARAIACELGRFDNTVRRVLVRHGGIVPEPRCRAERHLQLEEREEISRGLAAGRSFREIARQIRHAPATVCREVNTNGGRAHYRAAKADEAAWRRAKRPRGRQRFEPR